MVKGRHEDEEADRDLTIFRILIGCHLFPGVTLAAIYFNAISAAPNEK
jgi:hypothetical protein